jgi:hypothetical protein
MTNFKKVLSGLLLIGIGIALTGSTEAAQSFLLHCRGGGMGYKISFSHSKAEIFVRFKPGTAPAGQGLAPGQCSWEDRAFRPGEPVQICHSVSAFELLIRSSAANPDSATVTTFSIEAPYVADLRDPAKGWVFRVVNDGICMRVTAG